MGWLQIPETTHLKTHSDLRIYLWCDLLCMWNNVNPLEKTFIFVLIASRCQISWSIYPSFEDQPHTSQQLNTNWRLKQIHFLENPQCNCYVEVWSQVKTLSISEAKGLSVLLLECDRDFTLYHYFIQEGVTLQYGGVVPPVPRASMSPCRHYRWWSHPGGQSGTCWPLWWHHSASMCSLCQSIPAYCDNSDNTDAS